MLYNFYCFSFYLKQLDLRALGQRVIYTGVYAGCLRCKYYWLPHPTGLCCLVILIRKKIDSNIKEAIRGQPAIIWGGGHVPDFREQFFFLSDLLCSFSSLFFRLPPFIFFKYLQPSATPFPFFLERDNVMLRTHFLFFLQFGPCPPDD